MENLDFLNLNSLRNYPIKDGLSRVSDDGLFVIPNDLIVDMSIGFANGVMHLYISRIVNTPDSITIEIRPAEDGEAAMGNFIIPKNTPPLTDAALIGSTNFYGSVGYMTIGAFDGLASQPSGEFIFSPANTSLLNRVYAYCTFGVNYISFVDAKGNSSTLTGDVTILAESNLQFRTEGSSIVIDAGENLGLDKACTQEETPVKTINGVYPDSEGNFTLVPSDCTYIEPIEHGLMLQDTCGKPCVGCNDIGILTDRLVEVESGLLKVRDYVNNLQGMLTQLSTLINYQCECE